MKAYFEEFSSYLLSLKTPDGKPLSHSRRKTFIIGFISTFEFALKLSAELLSNGQEYFVTFRLSQDHIETLFSKIRRMGGFNNNPPASHFKAAIKRLLAKQSVCSSSSANSLDCESTTGVFQLKWSKRRSAPVDGDEFEEQDLPQLSTEATPIEDNILYYIAGYVVRSLVGRSKCEDCSGALVATTINSNDHQYTNIDAGSYGRLTTIKNRGGLTIPSRGVFQVIKRADRIFRQTICLNPEKYMPIKRLDLQLLRLLNKSCLEEEPVQFFTHSCAPEPGMMPHSVQLYSQIASKYFDIRLKHYTKQYNQRMVHKGGSDRSRLSRLVIFKHQ